MDGSQQFEYDVYETDDSSSRSESSDEDEGYEKEFVINQGMMYMTSCNINQDIIPLVLQGTVNTSQQCVCCVGSDANTGTINLNGVYDIYCDFLSYTSNKVLTDSIGNIFYIGINELNCNDFNNTIDNPGITQCPTKLLIPIINVNNTNLKNTINTDTIYITSILHTKISK